MERAQLEHEEHAPLDGAHLLGRKVRIEDAVEVLPGDPGAVIGELQAQVVARRERGDIPATMIWLFWGSGRVPDMPAFDRVYGLKAAMTSGVDLLRGIARMAGMSVLQIPGVTDLLDNDYTAQVNGALEALDKNDLVVIHIEAPDEAGHSGSIREKVEAIQRIDKYVISKLRSRKDLRLLIMPDHATPIQVRTHVGEPVPFLAWGSGFKPNGARRFSEVEAKKTGIFLSNGYNIMSRFLAGQI